MKFKTILVIILSLTIFNPLLNSASNKKFSSIETVNLSTLCKVWGFLKYYHPEVAKGHIDWDEVLISSITDFKNSDSSELLKTNVNEIILKAGSINYLDYENTQPESAETDPTFQWIDDESSFYWHTILTLKILKLNEVNGVNHYVDSYPLVGNTTYENEKKYALPEFPNENVRLLSLFRYWNIIQYFYPYKDVIGREWEDVLVEYIPKVINVKNALEYHLIMRKCTAEINDSHSSFRSEIFSDFIGSLFPPFKVRFIENKTVVTEVYPNLLNSENSIQVGDIILTYNGIDIYDRRNYIIQYMAASNSPTLQRNTDYYLLTGNDEFFSITLLRNGKEKIVYLKRITSDLIKKERAIINSFKKKYELLPGNIGYVDMGLIMEGDVLYACKDLEHTKGIIFDIRNYPNWTLYKFSNFLNSKMEAFCMTEIPDLNKPGQFYFYKALTAGYNGNEDYYKGKVIILVDERTQSQAEFTCMALQTAPNVTTIGSQTAGADGNVSNVYLPGGIQVYFTGIGIYYPSPLPLQHPLPIHIPTQRVGVKIDVVIRPTLNGIKEKKDELLEFAINLINNN